MSESRLHNKIDGLVYDSNWKFAGDFMVAFDKRFQDEQTCRIGRLVFVHIFIYGIYDILKYVLVTIVTN